MLFQQIVNIIFDTFIVIFNYFNNIFNCKNNKNNIIHSNIYFFLNDMSNKWKNNNINNIDLTCDILYLYNKYNTDKNTDKKMYYLQDKENMSQPIDEHMKYYTLGWYIYQNMENKS